MTNSQSFRLEVGSWELAVDDLLSLNVDSALELLALPAARARVLRIERQRRARLAADARVAQFVERQQRNVVCLRVRPHVARGPASDRSDPGNRPSGEIERLHFF